MLKEAQKTYIAIDLKSFYASVECVERGLDPLTTNLVVADLSRTEKTICLAVSPALKQYGIPGRARLFEVVRGVKRVNRERLSRAPEQTFTGKSADDASLRGNPSLELDYIVARPRMAFYMDYSTRIYAIYLRHVAPEDIHVYSIDEVFIDATAYLKPNRQSARDFARMLMGEVLKETGITATAGIGTNLYLAKVAMDIGAKHVEADANGARIAELDEFSYRRKLWSHRPLTDFWRVGRGYAKKLERAGLYTMGDVARCSLGGPEDYYNEDLLYKLFGVNAELLIDHAWGWEPCTIADIKAYKPSSNSLGAGQVLQSPYTFGKARLVAREMADALSLSLFGKGLAAGQLELVVCYDAANLTDEAIRERYHGAVEADRYGKAVPKPAHGLINFPRPTALTSRIVSAATEIYDRVADRQLLVRRIYITANRVVPEREAGEYAQLDLFSDAAEEQAEAREKRKQRAILDMKKKYGKNAVLKGMNFEEGATARERNQQIGGHRA